MPTQTIDEHKLTFRYFDKLSSLLGRLHEAGCARDRAGNRKLHMDQYVSLILLTLFNPIVGSLREIVLASELKKVQRKLGVSKTSVGSLSESASSVFDAELLCEVIGELVDELNPDPGRFGRAARDAVERIVTLVDGSLLAALPGIAQAMVLSEGHEGSGGGASKSLKNRHKLHTHFEIGCGSPVKAALTRGTESEREQLRKMLESDRLYVCDRGYYSCALFAAILDAGSSVVCRMPKTAKGELIETRPRNALDEADIEAGVLSDEIVTLGHRARRGSLDQPMRIVTVRCKPHPRKMRDACSRTHRIPGAGGRSRATRCAS